MAKPKTAVDPRLLSIRVKDAKFYQCYICSAQLDLEHAYFMPMLIPDGDKGALAPAVCAGDIDAWYEKYGAGVKPSNGSNKPKENSNADRGIEEQADQSAQPNS